MSTTSLGIILGATLVGMVSFAFYNKTRDDTAILALAAAIWGCFAVILSIFVINFIF